MPFEEMSVPLLLGRVIGLLLGFSIHEWAHAYSAYRMGDDTARWQGRLTLDPRAHIDPLGIFMALIVGIGWAKPVPVNPSRFYPHERRGLMITAFSGPLTNLLIAFFFAIVMRMFLALDFFVETNFVLRSTGATIVQGDGDFMQFIYVVMTTVVTFNLVLFFFNLIPLSPLDGWKVMLGLLPADSARQIARYERESTFALMMILMLGIIAPGFNPLWTIIGPPLRFVFELLTGFGSFIGTV